MNESATLTERDSFDDAAYLRIYPDIAAAVSEGRVGSAWEHYDRHGRHEGRIATDFDPEFYLRAYPLAIHEISTGLSPNPLAHYTHFGKSRGYLPHSKAPRPANAAGMSTPFGGLWPDLPNAIDLIAGKREIGQITERQASLLRKWVRDGYVVLERAIPDRLLEPAIAAFDKAYSGGFPDLLFECRSCAPNHIHWRPEIMPFPAKALDLHHFAPAIRDLIFAQTIGEFLGLIFESKVFASQTLGFLRGSAQEGHQDSAYVPYTIPRQFAATWIALEDVTIGAGELFYYVGSHKLEDFLYARNYKSVSEAQRLGDAANVQQEVAQHVKSLAPRAESQGKAKQQFLAKRGDVLVWHADLVHGGCPVSETVTRKSVVTHYCPKRLVPLFAEHGTTKLYHHDGHVFTTSYYANSEPEGLR